MFRSKVSPTFSGYVCKVSKKPAKFRQHFTRRGTTNKRLSFRVRAHSSKRIMLEAERSRVRDPLR
jgi:hypothetical protein